MKTYVSSLTVAALIAFACNSILCRLALAPGLIDAASFTSVRILSGTLTLLLICLVRNRGAKFSFAPNWRSVLALFVYMLFFSFAYNSLSTGTGALILFCAVQLTMLVVSLREGETFTRSAWLGFVGAIVGLVYLVSPGLTAPDPFGAALMAIAGVAWGGYSLLGRTAVSPLETTARNFLFSAPLAVAVNLLFWQQANVSATGLLFATISGIFASACGYVLWYSALPYLGAPKGAMVQLSVPVLAAFGGALFLSEEITPRLAIGSLVILTGIATVLVQKTMSRRDRSLPARGDRSDLMDQSDKPPS